MMARTALMMASAVALSASHVFADMRQQSTPDYEAIVPFKAGDRYSKTCTPTPPLSRYPYPGGKRIPTTNKMARPAGKANYAQGQLLYMHGRVFDRQCVPLKGAKVEIWHTNGRGEYRFADSRDFANPYPVFTGGGEVITDNSGEYVFETVFPGPRIKETPYINIRVTHPSLRKPLLTTLYFEGDSRNADDRAYRRLTNRTKHLVTAPVSTFFHQETQRYGVAAFYDLTVRSRDGFRDF